MREQLQRNACCATQLEYQGTNGMFETKSKWIDYENGGEFYGSNNKGYNNYNINHNNNNKNNYFLFHIIRESYF